VAGTRRPAKLQQLVAALPTTLAWRQARSGACYMSLSIITCGIGFERGLQSNRILLRPCRNWVAVPCICPGTAMRLSIETSVADQSQFEQKGTSVLAWASPIGMATQRASKSYGPMAVRLLPQTPLHQPCPGFLRSREGAGVGSSCTKGNCA